MSYWQTVLTQLGWPARHHESHIGTIGLTACAHGHGVSTVAMNLAATAAESASVLLVDANFRRPSLAKGMDIAESPGLVDALADSESLMRSVYRSQIHGLSVLPTGRHTNFNDCHHERFSPLVRSLAADFDLVICDFAPVTSDAEFLSWLLPLDRVFLVVEHGKIDAGLAQASAAMLRRSGAVVSGVILNQLNAKSWGY